jgi:hypothetical protein
MAGTAPHIQEYQVDTGDIAREGQIVFMIAGNGTDDDVIQGWDGSSTGVGQIVGVMAESIVVADTDRTARVYSDPNQIFEIQADGALTNMTDYVGSYFEVTNADAGNALTGRSTGELETGTADTTIDTINVLLGYDKVRDPEVDYTATNPRVQVKIAPQAHIFGSSLTGVAAGS